MSHETVPWQLLHPVFGGELTSLVEPDAAGAAPPR